MLPYEPPRKGEFGADDCFACGEDDGNVVVSGEHWRLVAPPPMGVPAAVLLYPVEHSDFEDLARPRLEELGVLMGRIVAALKAVGDVGRVHIYRFGDGGAHFHMWFVARPAGFLQFRGSTLTLWDEVLPKRPQDEWDAAMGVVSQAFEQAGGFVV